MPPNPLTRRDKLGLALYAAVVLAFGAIVLWRSAYQTDRKTDFGVYARAGYAVRSGENLYAVNDDRGWHYCYPPPFSLLMAPLADPWPWMDRAGYLPFGASVAIWYLFSFGCGAWAAHALAKAVLPDAVPGSRRWWSARMIPLLICTGGFGMTLTRGQVNLFLLAIVCGAFAAAVRGRAVRAGAWLAGAAALKVLPAYLALYPLVRREWRSGVGFALGLVAFLGLLPAAVWGIDGAVQNNRRFLDVVLIPGMTGHGDQSRKKELTSITGTDNQSLQAVIHNWQHPGTRETRPPDASAFTRKASLAVGGAMTLATVLVGWRRLRPAAPDQLIFFGCLCAVMVLLTPVSHLHYIVLLLPLVSGVWLKGLGERPGESFAGNRALVAVVAWGVVTGVPLFHWPEAKVLREAGLGTLGVAGLWAFGLAELVRRPAAAAGSRTMYFRAALAGRVTMVASAQRSRG